MLSSFIHPLNPTQRQHPHDPYTYRYPADPARRRLVAPESPHACGGWSLPADGETMGMGTNGCRGSVHGHPTPRRTHALQGPNASQEEEPCNGEEEHAAPGEDEGRSFDSHSTLLRLREKGWSSGGGQRLRSGIAELRTPCNAVVDVLKTSLEAAGCRCLPLRPGVSPGSSTHPTPSRRGSIRETHPDPNGPTLKPGADLHEVNTR